MMMIITGDILLSPERGVAADLLAGRVEGTVLSLTWSTLLLPAPVKTIYTVRATGQTIDTILISALLEFREINSDRRISGNTFFISPVETIVRTIIALASLVTFSVSSVPKCST